MSENNEKVTFYKKRGSGHEILKENYSIKDLFNEIKLFRLPIYQRSYVWKEENIKKLMEDLKKAFEKKENYWLGVLLLNYDEKKDIYYIIDGQQRIITILYLFKNLFDEPKDKIDLKYEEKIEDLFNKGNSFKKILEEGTDIKNLLNIKKYTESFKKSTKVPTTEFKDFINNSVYFNILICPNDYEYFENLNSKGTILSLKEKCYSYLISKYKDDILKNKEIKKIIKYWLQNDDDNITEYFIKIFYNKEKIEDFEKYKEITENKEDFNNFIRFIESYKKLRESKEKSKEGYKNYYNFYFYHTSWKIHLPLYIINDMYHPDLNKFLKHNIWKIDLYIHFLDLGKNLNKNDVIKTCVNIKKYKEYKEYQEAEGALHELFYTRIRLKKPSYNLEKLPISPNFFVEATTANNKREKMKDIFFLLFQSDNLKQLKNDLNSKKYLNIWESKETSNCFSLEHVMPKNPENLNDFTDKERDNQEKIYNLILYRMSENTTASNKNFKDKLKVYEKNQGGFFQNMFELLIKPCLEKDQDNIDKFWNNYKEIIKIRTKMIEPYFTDIKFNKSEEDKNKEIFDLFRKKFSKKYFKKDGFNETETIFFKNFTNKHKGVERKAICVNNKQINKLKNINNLKILGKKDNTIYICYDNKELLERINEVPSGSNNLQFNNKPWKKLTKEDLNKL